MLLISLRFAGPMQAMSEADGAVSLLQPPQRVAVTDPANFAGPFAAASGASGDGMAEVQETESPLGPRRVSSADLEADLVLPFAACFHFCTRSASCRTLLRTSMLRGPTDKAGVETRWRTSVSKFVPQVAMPQQLSPSVSQPASGMFYSPPPEGLSRTGSGGSGEFSAALPPRLSRTGSGGSGEFSAALPPRLSRTGSGGSGEFSAGLPPRPASPSLGLPARPASPGIPRPASPGGIPRPGSPGAGEGSPYDGLRGIGMFPPLSKSASGSALPTIPDEPESAPQSPTAAAAAVADAQNVFLSQSGAASDTPPAARSVRKSPPVVASADKPAVVEPEPSAQALSPAPAAGGLASQTPEVAENVASAGQGFPDAAAVPDVPVALPGAGSSAEPSLTPVPEPQQPYEQVRV